MIIPATDGVDGNIFISTSFFGEVLASERDPGILTGIPESAICGSFKRYAEQKQAYPYSIRDKGRNPTLHTPP